MEKVLIDGLIYSKFHSKIGPRAEVWYPSNINSELKDLASVKTINILSSEKGGAPKGLAIIPFPSFNLKAMVKALEIPDQKQRGGVTDASITLLFNEINDLIFYKYMNNFEFLFNETADKIIEKGAKADKREISEEIERLYSNLINMLDDLRETEMSGFAGEEFPSVSEELEKEYKLKIIVCGDPAVGKTSTVLRFTDRAFKRTYIPTIGVNITEKIIRSKNNEFTFIIWDIAGQTKFQRMRKHFYTGADGKLLIFDLTRRKTFDSIKEWFLDIKKNLIGKKDLHGFIIGNKCDLEENREVSFEEAQKLAKDLNLRYIETSAKTGKNVDEAFYELGEILTNN